MLDPLAGTPYLIFKEHTAFMANNHFSETAKFCQEKKYFFWKFKRSAII